MPILPTFPLGNWPNSNSHQSKTAQALSIIVPGLLLRADEVI